MGIALNLGAAQVSITFNIMVAGIDLALALICLMPDKARPDITRLEWHIVRTSLSIIFFCEAGRHFYLGTRAVYGLETPSQEATIAIVLNIVQICAAPFLFWAIFSMRKRLAFGDRER